MVAVRTITYDDKTAGRKVLSLPTELPFASCREEISSISSDLRYIDILRKISGFDNIYERAAELAGFLLSLDEPHRGIMEISSMAAAGDEVGVRLMYAALLTVQSVQTLAEELADFTHTKRLMRRIARKVEAGEELRPSEEWFSKKVKMLSMSHTLPNSSASLEGEPWMQWGEGVRLALADPDRKWEKAVLERIKVELEALEHRIRIVVASIDPESKGRIMTSLGTACEEARWRLQAVGNTDELTHVAKNIIKGKLEERWDDIMAGLMGSEAGSLVAGLFEYQQNKVHTYTQLKAGTAIVRAMMTNPKMRQSLRNPDMLSCLSLFTMNAGKGILEVMVPRIKDFDSLAGVPGFEVTDRVVRIDVTKAPISMFVDENEFPIDVDWTSIGNCSNVSYRSMVLTYMDNDNFLMEILNNPKAISKPGVVALIAMKCRSLRILSLLASRRDFYTGFMNKDVPLHILMNPARVPITSIRKFIHIKYVDKMTLGRLAKRGAQVREEVRREINRYLGSLG